MENKKYVCKVRFQLFKKIKYNDKILYSLLFPYIMDLFYKLGHSKAYS